GVPVVALVAACTTLVVTSAEGQCEPRWLPSDGVPGVDGDVHAIVNWDPDGAGPRPPLMVVGGAFTAADNLPANGIAAWDGSGWTTFGAGLNGTVHSLAALPDGDLVAGGFFTSAGDGPASMIARW